MSDLIIDKLIGLSMAAAFIAPFVFFIIRATNRNQRETEAKRKRIELICDKRDADYKRQIACNLHLSSAVKRTRNITIGKALDETLKIMGDDK